MPPKPQGRDFLIIDLEATFDDGSRVPKRESEIIEIGAVLVSAANFGMVDEFQSFVRPVRHPWLTPFCTQLTSITQAEVDNALGFVEVIHALRNFVISHTPGHRPPLLATWGVYDIQQFRLDAGYHNLELFFEPDHLNIKQAFSKTLRTRKHFSMV